MINVKYWVMLMIIILMTASITLFFIESERQRKKVILIANSLFLLLISPVFTFFHALIAFFLFKFEKITISSKSNNKLRFVFLIFISIICLICSQIKHTDQFNIYKKYSHFMVLMFYLRSLSVMFDIFDGQIEENSSFLKIFYYLSFFPLVIFGPIVKYKDFIKIYNENHDVNKVYMFSGLQYFVLGIFKKVVISNRLLVYINMVLRNVESYNYITILFATVTMIINVYFMFSGYFDMALGASRMIGYKFKDNYNLPFISSRPIEFWNRCNISLSSWIKKYVYGLLSEKKVKFKNVLIEIMVLIISIYVILGQNIELLYFVTYQLLLMFAYEVVFKNYRFEELKKKPKAIGIIFLNGILFVPMIILYVNSIYKPLLNHNAIFNINLFALVSLLLVVGTHVYGYLYNNGYNPIKHLDLGKTRNKLIFLTLIISSILFSV